MGHKHSVRDTGAHFIIDQYTKVIKNDSANKTKLAQYDHNSQRFTFEIPAVDGHVMALCDLIEIHFINISVDGNSQNEGVYEVNDIKADGENSVFTWLISQEATQLAGSLNFFIVFKCTENGETVYRWGTEIYKNLPVSEGMNNGEAVLTEYPDILAQWKARIFGASDNAVLAVETAKANALAAIEAAGEAKKQSVLDSIPDEYEALSALVDQNHRNKAGAIVLNAEGESIVVKDASEYPLQNLKVFGKSTQDGTPTPDAPVDIVSVKNPVVRVHGKNLINANNFLDEMFTKVENGYKFTKTADRNSSAICPVNLPVGQYVFSWKVAELHGVSCRLYIGHLDGNVETMGMGIEANDRVVLNTDSGIKDLRFSFYSTVEVDSYVIFSYLQLEVGSEPTEYEPYIEAKTVETSRTLPGIPVTSGGNYTDANGQQWICDEVDLVRGVYVQRIRSVELDASSDEYWYSIEATGGTIFAHAISDAIAEGSSKKVYCSHFKPSVSEAYNKESNACYFYDKTFRICHMGIDTLADFKAWLAVNAIKVVYILATPIETALTDAEITAFKALHSNKPVTTILNDAGAHITVEYVADTKTYIDNKIAEMMGGVTE